jgi:ribosome-binding protein aMBF1 (putative translation factor)
MPKKRKKQTADRVVEVNLKIAKKKLPLVSEALRAVLALAGEQISLEPQKTPKAAKGKKADKAGSAKAAPAPSAKKGRRSTVKKVKTERKNPPSPETAALIRDLRIKAGLSQKALAVKSGVSQNQISLLETGKLRLQPALGKKLGRLFNTPLPE